MENHLTNSSSDLHKHIHIFSLPIPLSLLLPIFLLSIFFLPSLLSQPLSFLAFLLMASKLLHSFVMQPSLA